MKTKVFLVVVIFCFSSGCGLVQLAEYERLRNIEMDKWMQECVKESHVLAKGMTLKEVERALCLTYNSLALVMTGPGYELYEIPNSDNSPRIGYDLDAQSDCRRWNKDFGLVFGIKSGRFWFENGRLSYWSLERGG